MDSNGITAFDRIEFRSRVAIAWGFLWRAMVITIASTLGGGIAGAILGFVAAMVAPMFGVNPSEQGFIRFVQVLGGTAGVAIGLLLFWQYNRWLFRARLGGYHLRLVRDIQDAV